MAHQSFEVQSADGSENNAGQAVDHGQKVLPGPKEGLPDRSNIDVFDLSLQDIHNLIHRLQVRQIELETKNSVHKDLQAFNEGDARRYPSKAASYFILNDKGLILDANFSSEIDLNCSRDQLLNKPLADFIAAADRDGFDRFMQNIADGNNTGQTLKVRTRIFRKAPFSLRCKGLTLTECTLQSCCLLAEQDSAYVELRPATYGAGNNAIVLAFSDVTEREMAEKCRNCLNEKLEEKIAHNAQSMNRINLELQEKIDELYQSKRKLREREARLNAIFNAAVEGIFTIDQSRNIVSANAAMHSIFGYTADELIGRNIDLLIPAQSGENHHAMTSSRVNEVISHVRTVEGLRKDGSLIPLDISISEFSSDGARYFTSIVRDASVRMQKEREDKAHLDELAQVTRLGLMGEMASGLAHELNQPLTAIAGYTQACLNFLQVDRPDLLQLRQVLQKTYEQALRAGQIIHRMRAFVSNKHINRSTIVINNLINVSLSLSFADLKANNIAPCLDLAEHLPALCGDSVQLEQVLINLIRNSVDALTGLPEGTERMLSIQTWLGEHHDVVIRVKDNGPGIDSAKQEKIFTPFYTSKKTGMGMGLSISQSIVKAHGGVLSFNSIPGKGTTFYFTLPVQEA